MQCCQEIYEALISMRQSPGFPVRGRVAPDATFISGYCVDALILSRCFIRIGIKPFMFTSERVHRAANASRSTVEHMPRDIRIPHCSATVSSLNYMSVNGYVKKKLRTLVREFQFPNQLKGEMPLSGLQLSYGLQNHSEPSGSIVRFPEVR